MSDEELRKQAWDYFQLQAGQRLTTFNFYIAISSLLTTGLATSFKADIGLPGPFREGLVGPLGQVMDHPSPMVFVNWVPHSFSKTD